MQIASFILVNDRALHLFEEQLEQVIRQLQSPQAAIMNLVPLRLHELGSEHPISIPVSSLYPLDVAAERQHARVLSAFEDPVRPSRLNRMASLANMPVYYVPPARVRDFTQELSALRLAREIKPEDVESLIGRRVSTTEMPDITHIIEQFRHDLYQIYHDAAEQGKGVVVFVVTQPDEVTSENEFPRAA